MIPVGTPFFFSVQVREGTRTGGFACCYEHFLLAARAAWTLLQKAGLKGTKNRKSAFGEVFAMRKPPFQATSHRPTQKEKTLRAFGAYLALLDTADWMQGQLRGQLESFDLTMGGFRLLEMLYREGPMSVPAAAEKRQCKRQNMDVIIARLEERGWVRREVSKLPPADVKASHIPKARRGRKREGHRVGIVRLTPLGEKFVGVLFPKHAKVVKALMRVLDPREQESLSRVCRKLREGDVLKFVSEITHEEVEDED